MAVNPLEICRRDPIKFARLCWPHVHLYDRQREILYSVRDNRETFVTAGNALGKDFIAAVAVLWWFLTRRPARVVTTSVKHDQLRDVLWGEMSRLIHSSRIPLASSRGGPLIINHLHLRQVYRNGTYVPLTEVVGQCVRKGESILGRHLPWDAVPATLLVEDEGSGGEEQVYLNALTWAHHTLVIGNPFPCNNHFRKAAKQGDQQQRISSGLRRKVIRIRAEDSPNVRLAIAQMRRGQRRPEPLLVATADRPWGCFTQAEYDRLADNWNGTPDLPYKTLIPGLITFPEYIERRLNYDAVMQSISLDGEFYEGAELLMFPPEWLDAAQRRHDSLGKHQRIARTIGIDPAEGGDRTAMAVVDQHGLIELVSHKTPDTSVIPREALALMHRYRVEPHNVFFDAGGGGKQHADALRRQGYAVRTVRFGESTKPERHRGVVTHPERLEADEQRYAYKDRRSQMYWLLRQRLDPADTDNGGFGLPLNDYPDLRQQLAPIPLTYDKEGRLELLPKSPRRAAARQGDSLLGGTAVANPQDTLTGLIGHSPDEADALVLAVYGLQAKPIQRRAGVLR